MTKAGRAVAVLSFPVFFQRMLSSGALQVDWDENEEFYRAWDEGRTGFPWIDAIMKQLHQHGWLHHLARHATVRPLPECSL